MEIIKRAQGGDSEAFEMLVTAHKRQVRGICWKMTHDETMAEDLAQDAFLQLFRKIGSFRGESAFGTWLYKLTANVVLMHIRKEKIRTRTCAMVSLEQERERGRWGGHDRNRDRRCQIEERAPMGNEPPVGDKCPRFAVMEPDIKRAIAALDTGYREVFVLHDVEGYEHHEIAELIGCTRGSSKSQLHKARLKVREFLTNPASLRAAEDRPRFDRRRFKSVTAGR